jgi:hypothetical protein
MMQSCATAPSSARFLGILPARGFDALRPDRGPSPKHRTETTREDTPPSRPAQDMSMAAHIAIRV